jgi:hypothetical protein
MKMLRRLCEDAPNQIEPVVAARQCHQGLMAEFRGQPAHGAGADVGRIGQDQVVAPPLQRVVQV